MENEGFSWDEDFDLTPEGVVSEEQVETLETIEETPVEVEEVIEEGTRFETLCPFEYTPERLMTLQRALKARLAYNGPITGVLDAGTRAAIKAFQTPQGIDSPLIQRGIAETLGVVSLNRSTL